MPDTPNPQKDTPNPGFPPVPIVIKQLLAGHLTPVTKTPSLAPPGHTEQRFESQV